MRSGRPPAAGTRRAAGTTGAERRSTISSWSPVDSIPSSTILAAPAGAAARPAAASPIASTPYPGISGPLDGGRCGLRGCHPESQRVRLDIDIDAAAALELAEEELVGERLLHLGLDEPRHRARAERGVVAARREPAPRRCRELDGDAPGRELGLQLGDEFVDHPLDRLGAERREGHDRIQAVAE